jgi:hypothetical protein
MEIRLQRERGIPSESLLVAADGGHRGRALVHRVTAVAAGAGVHRGKKHKVVTILAQWLEWLTQIDVRAALRPQVLP